MKKFISMVTLVALISMVVVPAHAGVKDAIVNNVKTFAKDSPYFLLLAPLFAAGSAVALCKSNSLVGKDKVKSQRYLKLAIVSYMTAFAVPITLLWMNDFFSK